uniref:Uncharacterized protein n=1 Tax=Oryza meridionalis TaxID=40149 RepID=A0A0E0DC65_9ORYZ
MAQPRGLASWRMLLLPSGRLLIFSHSGYKSTVQNHTTREPIKKQQQGNFQQEEEGIGKKTEGHGAGERTPERAASSGVILILWVMGADRNAGAWNNDFYQALNIIILPIIPEHHSPAGAILQAGFLAVISVFCIGNNLAVIKTMKTAKRKAWQGGVQKNPAAKEGP